MKILTRFVCLIALVAFSAIGASAQNCIPNTVLDSTGFAPADSLQPCVLIGFEYSTILQFKNFEELDGNDIGIGNIQVGVDSIRLDSIPNIEALGFTFDCAPNSECVIYKGENACIFLNGCADSSLFVGDTVITMEIYATVWTDLLPTPIPVTPQLLSDAGIDYRAFFVFDMANCTNTPDYTISDPTNNGAGLGADTTSPCIPIGIAQISNEVEGFSVSPNPINSNATISFTATKDATYTLSVMTLTGAVIKNEAVVVSQGKNNIAFNRAGLESGVYFISIGNGQSWVTERVIISE